MMLSRRVADVAAVAASAATQAHASGVPMRAEPIIFAAATLMAAVFGDDRLPPEQVLFLWSLAGTAVGAGVASLGMPSAGLGARTMRAALSFFAGMLLAPWVTAELPRAASTPDWWHTFAASGVGASIVYVLVAEGPALARTMIRAFIKAKSGDDNGNGNV